MRHLMRINGHLLRSAALVSAMLLAAPLAQAQQPAAPGAAGAGQPSPAQKEFMQTRAQLQQLQKQLGEIQQKVLDENPDLQQQREDFQKLVMTTMKDQGATPQEDVNKLKTLQAELQKEDLPKDKRQRLIQEFRDTNMALQQAQQQALQNKQVQEARKSLNNALITAMVDADPETEKLLSQVKQARQRLMQIQKEVAGQR